MEEELGTKFSMKNVDFSVIRKALQASGKMVEQLIDGIRGGGTEIRHLILEESDIIIECKICRNLFRALPNFVAHKRIYCLDSFVRISKAPSTYCPSPEDVVIVEPEPPDDARDFVRNLSESTKDYQSEPKTATDPKSVAKTPVFGKTSENFSRRKSNLLLFQKLTEIGSDEKSSSQVKTPKSSLESSKTSNSVTSKDRASQQELVLKSQLADYRQLKCRKCNQKLSSRNSLSHHIVNLHAERKRFYSCPYCGKVKGKFRYIGGVVRHLGTAHNLKKYQIDKLRKKVKDNCWFEDNLNDEVQPQKVSSKTNKNDLNGVKSSKEGHSQLKLKIKIFADSDTSKKPSYKMVQNDKQTIPDENPVESAEEDKLLELTRSETQSSEEVTSEPFCTPDEKELELESDLGNQALQNSDLSDEAASEISDKDSLSEVGDEVEMPHISETTNSGNRLALMNPSIKLSPLRLSMDYSELYSAPTTSQESVVLTTSNSDESFEQDYKFESSTSKMIMQSQTDLLEEAASGSVEGNSLEKRSDLTLLKTLNSPKPDQHLSVGLESVKDELSLNGSPCHSEQNTVIKARSSRSRMLFVCEHCKKCFGQRKKLDEHARLCSDWIHQPKPSSILELQKPKTVLPKQETKREKRDFIIEPKKAIRRSIEKPAESILVDPPQDDTANSLPDGYDKDKVLAMIDGKALKCLDCNQNFSNQSHLRRHAVRHLGWRRFKCKLCMFTSYDKSETKTHIKRCHLGKTHGLTTKSVDYYIVDLKADSSKSLNKKITSSLKRSDKAAKKSSKKNHSPKKNGHSLGNFNGTKCKDSDSEDLDSQTPSKFNDRDEKKISFKIVPPLSKTIRTSPRKPVPKIDRMSSLFLKKY